MANVHVVGMKTVSRSEGGLEVQVTLVRLPGSLFPFEVTPDASDLPADIRGGLIRWAEEAIE